MNARTFGSFDFTVWKGKDSALISLVGSSCLMIDELGRALIRD